MAYLLLDKNGKWIGTFRELKNAIETLNKLLLIGYDSLSLTVEKL